MPLCEPSPLLAQACDLHAQAIDRHAAGDPVAALALLAQADACFTRAEGQPGLNSAAVWVEASAIHEQLGDARAAETWLGRAIALLPNPADPHDTAVGTLALEAHQALGRLLRQRAAYAEAWPHACRALALAEGLYPADSPDLVRPLNELGMLCKYTGRFDQGQAHYHRALALLADPERADSGWAATLHHNLGGIAHARGDHAAGEPHGRRAVALRRHWLARHQGVAEPDRHPALLADEAAWAALLAGLGRHDEACAVFERVLPLFEAHFGPDHYEVAVTLQNLALSEMALGRLANALPRMHRSKQLKLAQFGPGNVEVGLACHNLGLLQHASGDQVRARDSFAEAMAIFEAELGPDHPSSRASRASWRASSGGR